jgi:chloramphenicol 3-O-phosphotransferase
VSGGLWWVGKEWALRPTCIGILATGEGKGQVNQARNVGAVLHRDDVVWNRGVKPLLRVASGNYYRRDVSVGLRWAGKEWALQPACIGVLATGEGKGQLNEARNVGAVLHRDDIVWNRDVKPLLRVPNAWNLPIWCTRWSVTSDSTGASVFIWFETQSTVCRGGKAVKA